MGNNPLAPRRPLTTLEVVREQYATGARDLESLERAVEWLLRHSRADSREPIAAHWPPLDDDRTSD